MVRPAAPPSVESRCGAALAVGPLPGAVAAPHASRAGHDLRRDDIRPGGCGCLSGSSGLGGDEEKVHVIPIKTDLTVIDQVQALFKTTIGIPDVIYAMHGIMSRGSEDNFELGLRVGSSRLCTFSY